ncbi:uncharacterized protein M6D78_004926 [Vipera latastei]
MNVLGNSISASPHENEEALRAANKAAGALCDPGDIKDAPPAIDGFLLARSRLLGPTLISLSTFFPAALPPHRRSKPLERRKGNLDWSGGTSGNLQTALWILDESSCGINWVILTLFLVAGPRRLEVSLSLAVPPGPPRFGDQNEVRRGLYLRMQLGLSLVSAHDGFQTAAHLQIQAGNHGIGAHDGFQTAAHLQIQAGNHGIGDQGGSLLAWNFNCLLQWTRWIQRHSISYYALRLFSNWWRIPGGLQLSSDFQGRFPNFVGNHTLLHGRIQLVSN